MSYDITSWRTLHLYNLCVPAEALMALPRGLAERGFRQPVACWHCGEANIARIALTGDGSEIDALYLEGGMLDVTRIVIIGEGSGQLWNGHLLDVLGQSTGDLEAEIVWARGDNRIRFSLRDGDCKETFLGATKRLHTTWSTPL